MKASWLLVPLLALAAGACVSFNSAGDPAIGFLDPAIEAAYLPLAGSEYLVLDEHAAGVVIAPNVAVTNAHNADLVPKAARIGESRDYDLLFFRTPRQQSPPRAEPYVGEPVVAYGQGVSNELRVSKGVVRGLEAPVLPRCGKCAIQQAFIFDADAGKGFSGGPVVDAKTGKLVGIVFGFQDDAPGRLMYAYDLGRVDTELARFRDGEKTAN